MRTRSLLCALAFFAAAAPAARGSDTAAAATAARAVHIVQFDEPPLAWQQPGEWKPRAATKRADARTRGIDVDAAHSRTHRARLRELRDERLRRASALLGRALRPSGVFDLASHGVALELTPDEARRIAAIDGVRSVRVERQFEVQGDVGPQWIHADALWNCGGPVSRGEGTVLAVLDTGIQRSHPAFATVGPEDGHVSVNPTGQGFGRCAAMPDLCTGKLIGIYDYTGGDGADRHGHGTHVASIAVGHRFQGGFQLTGGAYTLRSISGVAPHASVISYKVCRDSGFCAESAVLGALDQAVADGVDVINTSFVVSGDVSPWADAVSLAVLAAREAGVLTVAGAGNAGPASGGIGSPASAPWTLAVGAITHDRAFLNRVVDLVGGIGVPPSGGVLFGMGKTGGVGPRPLAFDPQYPHCARPTDSDAAGASNPWPAGRFDGQIVVCRRGAYLRTEQSENVRLAGGAGMVLVNGAAAEGEWVLSEVHPIPTSHIGFDAGQSLLAWMTGATAPTGRLEGARVVVDAALGGRLAPFSSRGPAPASAAGVLIKPELVAPGQSILGASLGGQAVAYSGTSMASPQVAGVALLLAARHPDWPPARIASALVSGARADVVLDEAGPRAGVFEQGAGQLDATRAAGAGLTFELSAAQFRAADPARGGVPRDLNLPGFAHERCRVVCGTSRTVTDLGGGGAWRVEFELPAGLVASATPAQFTLGAGASQEVALRFDVGQAAAAGGWVEGRVRFVRTADPGPATGMPLALFVEPGLFVDGFEG
jgi:subtilisin family serine protease